MTQLIDYLIEQKGISTEYIDAWGKPTSINKTNQEKLLSAMGYAVDDEQALAAQLEAEAVEYWTNALAPVMVFRRGQSLEFTLRVNIFEAAHSHTLKINFEDGSEHSQKIVPVDYPLLASQEIDGIEWQEYKVTLTGHKHLGYHTLSLLRARKKVSTTPLIIAPQSCYTPKVIRDGNKIWGLSVQLYCIRSKRNWGLGDFTDLMSLATEAANVGADFVGLNPIHALYPADPSVCSPYGPSSRQWLNYLYLDPQAIEGFDSKAVQQWWLQDDTQSLLQRLRECENVDYEGVAKLKLKALTLLFNYFDEKHLQASSKLSKQFNAFVENGGKSLQAQATFDALQMHLKQAGLPFWGWPVFPDEYKNIDNPAVKRFAKTHHKQLSFYLFLQWQAELQFQAASKAAKKAGMSIGLYKDLAVGVSEGGSETWGNQALYCTDISVGAPPDVLGPLGQKWGLPPMVPEELIKQAYRPIKELFASNMANTGALRIDHVMAFLRLWWVHKDNNASEGVYVNYPVDDLLAIVALESVRNKSLVIGEDLGTVPAAFRDKLQANGMYSYRVFFFEQAPDGGFFSPSHYPEQSMSTLTTHDMPTLSGFWHCDDLVLGKELGLYTDAQVLSGLYHNRHQNKQRILDTLHGHGSLGAGISQDVNYVGMSKELNFAMQAHMAGGSSALLSLQLEDWLQMDKPVNIPGTFHEYPNWQRKLSLNLEDIFGSQEIRELTSTLNARRKHAKTKNPN